MSVKAAYYIIIINGLKDFLDRGRKKNLIRECNDLWRTETMKYMKKLVAVVLAVMLMVPSVIINAEEVTAIPASNSTADSPALTDIGEASISISNFTYTGEMKAPSYSVSYNGTVLERGTDYTISGLTHCAAGLYTVTLNGIGKFTGTTTVTYRIYKKAGLSATAVKNLTYNGKNQKGKATVTCGGVTLTEGKDFKYTSGLTHCAAGTYKVTVTGIGNYKGTATYTYKINKAAQTLSATQTKSASYKTLRTKSITVTPAKGIGKISYEILLKNPNNKKYVSVNTTSGKITIKKGAVKGTYRVKLTFAGDKNRKAASTTVSVVVK